jgi:tRNA(fMet)-specific endonuclease VapC
MILFDTDICVEILRGNGTIIATRRRYQEEIGVSFITVAELYYGVSTSSNPDKNQRLVDELLLTVHVIESDRRIERRFGRIKAQQNRQGRTVADADLLIAATTLERCSMLVTGNVRHFEMIAGLPFHDWRSDPQERP